MSKIGFRVGTEGAKSNLTGVGKEAKNIINGIANNTAHEYLLLEPDRFGLNIAADNAVLSKDAEKMTALQCFAKEIDLLHSFYDPCLNFGGKTKKVLTINDMIFVKYPQWSGDAAWSAFWTKKLSASANAADCIIAISEATKQDVVACFGIKPEKIRVVYIGLDSTLQEEHKSAASCACLPGDSHSQEDSFCHALGRYILSVCTLEPRKNLVGLVKAFERYKAAAKDDPVKLVIVGKTGWMTNPIFESVRTSRYADDIVVTGYVTDDRLQSLYQNCLFAAYPSFYEGFGLPILEAMAFGKTVAASNTSSMPEVGGDAVCYCSPHEEESIVNALSLLCQNDSLRRTLEQKAKQQAAKFSYAKAVGQTAQIYRELL